MAHACVYITTTDFCAFPFCFICRFVLLPWTRRNSIRFFRIFFVFTGKHVFSLSLFVQYSSVLFSIRVCACMCVLGVRRAIWNGSSLVRTQCFRQVLTYNGIPRFSVYRPNEQTRNVCAQGIDRNIDAFHSLNNSMCIFQFRPCLSLFCFTFYVSISPLFMRWFLLSFFCSLASCFAFGRIGLFCRKKWANINANYAHCCACSRQNFFPNE